MENDLDHAIRLTSDPTTRRKWRNPRDRLALSLSTMASTAIGGVNLASVLRLEMSGGKGGEDEKKGGKSAIHQGEQVFHCESRIPTLVYIGWICL